MLERAVLDMRGRWSLGSASKARREATLWLGSSEATKYFDWLDLDQPTMLVGMGWPEHARRLLDEGGLAGHERELLQVGLAALDKKGGKGAVADD